MIITRESETTVDQVQAHAAVMSDHMPLTFSLHTLKPPNMKVTISSRKLKDVDIQSITKDIMNSTLVQNTDAHYDVISLVDMYNSTLSDIIDKHAPVTTRQVQLRSRPPWFNSSILKAKRERRKKERLWLSDKSTANMQQLQLARNNVTRLCSEAKKEYYHAKIEGNAGNQKALYQVTNHLLGKSKQKSLPEHKDPKALANEFAKFFKEKIDKIRQLFTRNIDDVKFGSTDQSLRQLVPVSEDQVKKIIMEGNNKSCTLDPIPTTILKSCIDSLIPIITRIINASMATAVFPPQFKTASVVPVLKKPELATDELANYRPVSNLPYLGKITEKVVVRQFKEYMEAKKLNPPLQSAYRKHHSTETAIVKIMNDILLSLDNDLCVLLVMLDLSAAFDTVDHKLLFNRFEQSFGIQGEAREWLRSYFTGRFQAVRIDGVNSDPTALETGMPQGSVIGPFCFPPYTSPLFTIANKYKCQMHMYADDTQLYMSCEVLESEAATFHMEDCVAEVKEWMTTNFLKLNDSKTEVVLLRKQSRNEEVDHIKTIRIGNSNVKVVPTAKNIGCFIDSNLTMEAQVASITRKGYGSIHEIARILPNLTKEGAEILINSQVTSKLDNFNAVLYGISPTLIRKLQLVQNSAARLITRTKTSEHITPVLKKLHWLPVAFRIEYKILLLCFKSLHHLAPAYLCELITRKIPTRELRPSSIRELVEPKANSKTYGDRAFSIIAPRLWNKLPSDIRKLDKLETFKTKLKTRLYSQAFRHC